MADRDNGDVGMAVLDGLFSVANKLATPFAQTLAYGKETASDLALLQERNRINSLNGSGANNPGLALQAPHGIWDFLFGAPDSRGVRAGGAGGSVVLVVGGVILLAVFIFMRR